MFDLFGQVDEAGWFGRMSYVPYPIADNAQLLPVESWSSHRLPSGKVLSVSDASLNSTIQFKPITGRHFQLCAPTATVLPELDVAIDDTSYWLQKNADFNRIWLDDEDATSYSCFAEFNKVEMGLHTIKVTQRTEGKIEIGTLLVEKPVQEWTAELFVSSVFYIFATFVAWLFLISFLAGTSWSLYILGRLILGRLGLVEYQPIRRSTQRKFGRLNENVDREGLIVLEDNAAEMPPASAAVAAAARPEKAAFALEDEDDSSLLPQYQQWPR